MFNVVLFHIDDYDETYPYYKSLYQKCYESVLREFKNDNIIVFHNYNECFNKYPKLKKIIDTRFSNFFYDNEQATQLKVDLLRLLLSIFLENYLYIDSDIYISSGFKKLLENKINNPENKNKVFFNIEKNTIAIFYIKKYFNELNKLLQFFADNTYQYDTIALAKSDFYQSNKVCDSSDTYNYYHYCCLHYLYQYICHDYYLEYDKVDNFNKIISKNKNIFCFFPENKFGVIYHDKNNVFYYGINDDITLDDILGCFNIRHIKG